MATIKVKHIDTFTTIPHRGNPAGVVLNADNLTDAQMSSIAREINLTETAFVQIPELLEGLIKIRIFSPSGELMTSGHAAIAAMYALAESNMLGMDHEGEFEFRLETAGAIIPAKVKKGKKNILIALRFLPTDLEKASQYKVDIIRLLNISFNEFDSTLSLQRNGFLFVPLRRLHTLFTMKPNMEAISSFLLKREFDGLCVFTTETVERHSLVHSRVFAPHIGIQEDSVTGFTHLSLAQFLFHKDLIPNRDGKYVFQAEQGDVLGRKGRLEIELVLHDGQPEHIVIRGSAVTVLEGEMLLPE